MGETFGLAIAELAIMDRPIITERVASALHLEQLGDRALLYSDRTSVERILMGFQRGQALSANWKAYEEYRPPKVMRAFLSTFFPERDSVFEMMRVKFLFALRRYRSERDRLLCCLSLC